MEQAIAFLEGTVHTARCLLDSWRKFPKVPVSAAMEILEKLVVDREKEIAALKEAAVLKFVTENPNCTIEEILEGLNK